jgi:hypothetical protein
MGSRILSSTFHLNHQMMVSRPFQQRRHRECKGKPPMPIPPPPSVGKAMFGSLFLVNFSIPPVVDYLLLCRLWNSRRPPGFIWLVSIFRDNSALSYRHDIVTSSFMCCSYPLFGHEKREDGTNDSPFCFFQAVWLFWRDLKWRWEYLAAPIAENLPFVDCLIWVKQILPAMTY